MLFFKSSETQTYRQWTLQLPLTSIDNCPLYKGEIH